MSVLKRACHTGLGNGSSKFCVVSTCGTYLNLCCAKAQEKVGSKGLSNQRISGKFPHSKAKETEGGKGHCNHSG